MNLSETQVDKEYKAKYGQSAERRRIWARGYYQRNKQHIRAVQRKRLTAAVSRRDRGLPEPTRPLPPMCECCGKPPGRKTMNLDHCHETGKFRGWLCAPCNMAIGRLGDNLAGLARAVAYLNHFHKEQL